MTDTTHKAGKGTKGGKTLRFAKTLKTAKSGKTQGFSVKGSRGLYKMHLSIGTTDEVVVRHRLPARGSRIIDTVIDDRDMISIPADEYEALKAAAEELEDLRAYDRAKLAIANGDDELVPAEIASRLIEGGNPLRVWRDYRQLTQAALAEAAGVNRVQITDIEAGRTHGSVDTLRKLADALGVLMDDLV